jgi:mannose-6-phosphate isomerase
MPRGITKLASSFQERIWGTTRLTPWFPDSPNKIGEVWFPAGEAASLLVKFIFTSENLSVQVHPSDAYALLHENSRGKTEMWHILDAIPGASIALGFRERITREQFEEALQHKHVEELLNWVPAQAGDSFFAPAGTVHAIGAGITLCEIQQNSDVTYRLYDYGRPRELHLDRGLAVSNFEPYDGKRNLPITCEYFTAEALALQQTELVYGGHGRERLLITLEGEGLIGGEHYQAGEVWEFKDDCQAIEIEPVAPTRMLRATAP